MRDSHRKALEAAQALARQIALKSYQGSVVVWEDAEGKKIVICARRDWIDRQRSVPKAFHGFRVEVTDELGAIAH